jgi:LCP family protein required for cell wall assembly
LADTLAAVVTTGETSVPHSTRSQRVLIGVALLLFAAASAYLALVIITRVDSIFSPFRQVTLPGPVQSIPLPGVDSKGQSGNMDRTNILVVGLDARAGEGDFPSRTDTIFIVTVDPKTDSTGILGIPRDLLVDIPYSSGSGTYQDRINSVYVAGELNGYDQGGVELMKEVLKSNYDIDIHKYVMVDFQGFESIVDALGGIDVDVPERVFDPYYSETELPGDYLPQDFEVGQHHMDGQTALAYARIRFSSDDFDRIQRQQRVIFATIDKAKSLNVLADAPSLWSKYKDTIETDISDLQILSYADLANRVKDNIAAVSLGPVTVPYTTPEGAAVLIGDDEAIAQIVDSMFKDKPGDLPLAVGRTPEPVRVQIQNGAGVEGLASEVMNYIITRGYSINDVSTDNVFDGETHTETEILDVDGDNENRGYQLADDLGFDPSIVRAASPAEREALNGVAADIVVILGTDFDLDTVLSDTTTTGG